MFNCIWNGEIISADKIAESEVSERKVRNAAIRDELICICPDCEFRRLTYKHGDKKRPHFAHIKNSNCTYSQFDKMDKPVIRHIRNALYKHFKNLGYDIEQEVYLPNSRKFVHLLLNFPNKKIVLQIAEESISTRTREELSTVCEESGCDLKWIVIGDTDAIQDDYDNHHINRYLLHNSRNNDLIIISKNATTISQTRLDNEDYMFNGTNYKFQLGNKFYMSATLKQLVIIEGEITIDEFIEKYHQYITNKKIKIEQLKLNHESRRARMNKLTSNVQTSNIFTVNKISPRLERSPQSYEPAPIKIDYNIYKVGAKVYHENYGYGSITSIDNYTNKAVIEFDSGMKERFNIKNLYKSDRFTIV